MKKIIYIDMDGVLADFTTSYNQMKNKFPSVQYPQSVIGFWENLEPIEGAIDAFKSLSKDIRFDAYILTSPSIDNPHCYSEKRIWVEKHLGYQTLKCLIISPNKSLLLGDILIDNEKEGKGQDQFQGKLIHFGSKLFPNWSQIIFFLNQQYLA